MYCMAYCAWYMEGGGCAVMLDIFTEGMMAEAAGGGGKGGGVSVGRGGNVLPIIILDSVNCDIVVGEGGWGFI